MTRDELIEAMARAMAFRTFGQGALTLHNYSSPDIERGYIEKATDALAAIEAQGLAIVPVEPDNRIVSAGVRQSAAYPVCPPEMSIEPVHQFTLTCCYRAMINAGKL